MKNSQLFLGHDVGSLNLQKNIIGAFYDDLVTLGYIRDNQKNLSVKDLGTIDKKIKHIRVVLDFFYGELKKSLNQTSMQEKMYKGSKFVDMPFRELIETSIEIGKEMYSTSHQNQIDSVKSVIASSISGEITDEMKESPQPVTDDVKRLVMVLNFLNQFLYFISTPLEGSVDIAIKTNLIKSKLRIIDTLKEDNIGRKQKYIDELEFLESPFFRPLGAYFMDTFPEALEKEFLDRPASERKKVSDALHALGSYAYMIQI